MPTLSPPAQAVLDLIRSKPGVTFVEIDNVLQDAGINTDGGMTLHHGEPSANCVLWINASKEFAGAVNELLGARLVHYRGVTPLTYIIDGRTPDMPVAKSAGPFKHPRWLPVEFNAGPAPK